MEPTEAPKLITYEARIWEKKEHWHFDATVEAASEKEAFDLFRKEYPARTHKVGQIYRKW